MALPSMDSVLNRLRNTVSSVTSTVSQLSVVLPGNPVCREYEVIGHIASAGPGLLWKIYSGYKKSTKQEASIFIFEKKELDKWGRKDKERMIETLKKGVQQLTKLRHPRILTVQHPLEESRETLAFATEPVLGSLANVLGNMENAPHPISSTLKDYTLDEIEIKYGLLQVAEGLQFLHRDAKLIHGNLCPESIILSEQGSWKISGFDFALIPLSTEGRWVGAEFDVDAHLDSRPNLDYVPPEYEKTPVPQSDLFALGVLTFAVFNHGETVFASGGNLQARRYNLTKLDTLSEARLRGVPQEIRAFIKSLLSSNPDLRPDAHLFSKLGYLDLDERVKTLSYLDSLFQLDNLQKSKFFKGLTPLLEKLPQRVRLYRVVPCLAGELLNPTMVPFVLPNLLKIGEWSTKEEFIRHVLPHLREPMKIRDPIQVLFIFLKNMDFLLEKTPADFQKSDLLPLLYAALDTDASQMQELALGIIPSLAQRFDHAATKNQLLPRIRKLTLSTQTLSVRVNCLVCLGKILEEIEKWLVMDFVLPFLTEIPSREPPVIMAILGILKVAASNRKLGLTKEVIATRILPFLFPLTVENGLGMRQLEALLSFIHELIDQVTKEQTAKIKTINANEATDTSFGGMEGLFPGLSNGTKTPSQKESSYVPISPVPVEKEVRRSLPTTPQQPKDLRDTLIQSQINQLTISPHPIQNQQTIGSQQIQGANFTSQQQQVSFPRSQTFPNQQVLSFPHSQQQNFLTQSQPQQQNLRFSQPNYSMPKEQMMGSAKALSTREIDELLK